MHGLSGALQSETRSCQVYEWGMWGHLEGRASRDGCRLQGVK